MSKDCDFEHVPVLFNECMEALNIDPDGLYVDCTAGGGGHSKGVLVALLEVAAVHGLGPVEID